ncbi:MAG: hypothetical protein ACOH18_05545 [Candidatus Saccharimonadaceae bacterium]
MALKKYTIAEFRKATREAFNEVESGGKVFITRHSTRYELVKADVQGGKKQLEETTLQRDERIQPGVYNGSGLEIKIATPTPAIFPNNGDSGAQINTVDDLASAFGPALPEKNNSEADASVKSTNADCLVEWDEKGVAADTNTLHVARGLMRNQLAGIDIDTQDPDEVELGATLAANIDAIAGELKKRGVE